MRTFYVLNYIHWSLFMSFQDEANSGNYDAAWRLDTKFYKTPNGYLLKPSEIVKLTLFVSFDMSSAEQDMYNFMCNSVDELM